MRRTDVRHWVAVLGGLGILSLTGCDMSLKEAAESGLFDFVAGTITDTLSSLVPIADTVANVAG